MDPRPPGRRRSLGTLARLAAIALLAAAACEGDPARPATPADPPAPDTLTLTWLPLGDLPEGLDGLVSARGFEGVYVAGGETADGTLRDGFRLFTTDGSWRTLSPLPRPLRDTHLVAFGDVLYLVGGVGEEDGRRVVTDALHRYDTESDSWTQVGRAPMPVYGGAAGVMDGTAAVVGALHDLQGAGSPGILAYDPELDEWRTLEPPERPRLAPSANSRQGDLFLAGGVDPATGEPVRRAELRHNLIWHDQGTTPRPRIGVAGTHQFSRPWLLGGVDEAGTPVEPYAVMFDRTTGRWTPARPPPIAVPVRGHRVEPWVSEDQLLILGGRRADGSLSPSVFRVTLPRPGGPS